MSVPAIAAFMAAFKVVWLALIVKTLVMLGIGVTVYVGVDLALNELLDLAVDLSGDLMAYSVPVAQVTRALRIDQAISLVVSAITLRWTLQGLFAGTLVKWAFFRPPGA